MGDLVTWDQWIRVVGRSSDHCKYLLIAELVLEVQRPVLFDQGSVSPTSGMPLVLAELPQMLNNRSIVQCTQPSYVARCSQENC